MIRPRAELIDLQPAPHGGDVPPGVLDFSTGISPLPAPREILQAAREADLSRYPHPTALPLRQTIADSLAVSPDEIVCGAGACELIWAIARAFGGIGRRGLVVGPAFGEYRQALLASGAGCDILPHPLAPFLPAQLPVLDGAQLIFICRPSNPGLGVIDAALVDRAAQSAPDTLFVVDESYLPLFEEVAPLVPRPNILQLRSLTKIFALPGLRLGYLHAAPEIARAIQSALPPWNVSAPALAAGQVAVALLPEAASRIAATIAERRRALVAGLRSRGAIVDADGGTFVLCKVGDARAATARLSSVGIRVRDAGSMGLSQHIRIGVRDEAAHAQLVAKY